MGEVSKHVVRPYRTAKGRLQCLECAEPVVGTPTGWFHAPEYVCPQCGPDHQDGETYLEAANRHAEEQHAVCPDDIDVRGHKVFVFNRGGPCIEMVNDDRPLVRMTIALLPEEAREIAQSLLDAADGEPDPPQLPDPTRVTRWAPT